MKDNNPLNNIVRVGAGYASSQIAKDSDEEIDTLLRVIGSDIASYLILGGSKSNNLLTLGAAIANSVHGYKRSDGSIGYAILWAFASNSGLGLALGQGFGELPKRKKRISNDN